MTLRKPSQVFLPFLPHIPGALFQDRKQLVADGDVEGDTHGMSVAEKRLGLRRSWERGHAVHFQAEFDGFADSQHDVIEGLGLGVAAVQLRNGGYVIALSVTLDNDVELSRHCLSLQRVGGR